MNVLTGSSESYLRIKKSLGESAQELERIASSYRDITAVAGKIGQINSAKTRVQTCSARCGSFSQAIERIEGLYRQYETRISDECDGVRRLSVDAGASVQNIKETAAKVAAMLGSGAVLGAAAVSSGELQDGTLGALDSSGVEKLRDIRSAKGKLGTFLEYFDHITGGNIGEVFKDVTETDFLKAAGYLDDYEKLTEAWASGDADTVENLLEKYIKKGTGALLLPSSGIVGDMYIDIGWNIGENITESANAFREDPSFSEALDMVWNSTAGAVWDTGTDLGKDAMELWHSVWGTEFDEADYDMAMDWLKNFVSDVALGPSKLLAGGLDGIISAGSDNLFAAGEAFVEGVAEAGKEVFDQAALFGEAVVDTAAAAGEAIAEGAAAAGEAIAEGAKAAGKAVADGASAMAEGAKNMLKGAGKTIASWLPF